MIHNFSKTSYLILGGARSGKSKYAEDIAKHYTHHFIENDLFNTKENTPKKVTYIATATPFDEEMKTRIKQHQNDRPDHWLNIEEPLYLAKTLEQNASENNVILIDCLTLWINNLLMQEDVKLLKSEVNNLINCLKTLPGIIIFVSNEVGMGVIPTGSITRQFIDETGRLHQQLAQQVSHVLLMVAGIPTTVKGNAPL